MNVDPSKVFHLIMCDDVNINATIHVFEQYFFLANIYFGLFISCLELEVEHISMYLLSTNKFYKNCKTIARVNHIV